MLVELKQGICLFVMHEIMYTHGICQSDADQIDNQKDEFEKTGDTRHA